jgi:hypothetical protein
MPNDKPFHAKNLTPEEMTEALRKIRGGSTDGGQTLPKSQKTPTEGFDARTATPAEIDAEAKRFGVRIHHSI